MIDALRITKYSLQNLWEEFVWLLLLNLLWSLTVTLPLAPLILLNSLPPILVMAASLVLLIPVPIVTGGLCFVANQVSRGKVAKWSTFVIGIRRYWAKSLVVALINLVVLILLAANIQFYGTIVQGTWTTFALAAWLIVTIYWLLSQMFWFPMILELENEKVLLALRNALVMVIITPGFSITAGILMIVLAAICVALTVPAIVLMAALLLLMANHATRSRLAHVQKKPYVPLSVQEETNRGPVP